MGASSSIIDRSSCGLNNNSAGFSKTGVKLSFYDKFITSCGGVELLSGKTTKEICEEIIKPMTSSSKLSYCDLLNLENHPAINVATVFVSHCWNSVFLDVLAALNHHFKENPDVVVWFDVFSHNLHHTGDLTTQWYGSLRSTIAEIGQIVIMFDSWNKPLSLSRTWCLFEIFCGASTGVKFEVAMSQEKEALFLQDMEEDSTGSINQILGKSLLINLATTSHILFPQQ
jgi:hypothetical protein